MPLVWLHERKKQKVKRQEGETKTQREADTHSEHLRAGLMPPVKRITQKLRENPPLECDLCVHHCVHSDSTVTPLA